jgi:molybdopterin molybdotransferase
MITLDEARAKIDAAIDPLPPVKLPVVKALGCCTAGTTRSPIDVPGFDCSIMDGIALRFDDLKGNGPWRLPIQNVIAAGVNNPETLEPGHVCKIMTGAPMPAGADTVIKIEDISIENNQVIIQKKPLKSEHVRPRGDDVQKDDILFEKGTVLTPIDIGVIASVGLIEIEVIPHPKIALLSTGSEIIAPGNELQPGQRYDANSFVLKSMFSQNNFPAELTTVAIPDKMEQLKTSIEKTTERNDIVITSGGVSMGDFDYIPDVVNRLGGEILFHKVKIKPGKPVLVAKVKNSWLIALPGNPVSVVTGFHLFVKRIISRLMSTPYHIRSTPATITADTTFDGTRLGFLGAQLEENSHGIKAHPVTRQNSGRLSSVKGINGFIILQPGRHSISAGEKVDAEWLY